MHDDPSFRGLSQIALAALLASAAIPALAASSAGATSGSSAASVAVDATSGAQSTTDPSKQNDETIYVTAPPLFPDILPERSLDQDAIDSYGASTVDDLLGELQVELGDDVQPLLIVNGQRINDLSEIGALPVEVLRNIEILPRGSAVRAGGTSMQRIVSITLKRHLRTATLTAAHKVSTDGHWNADRGEAMLTSVKGDTRANLTFRVRDESQLLESQRGIIQPAPLFPFALGGNIIGFPDTSGEIDPLLSALAGRTVTVVPVPGTANPTLAQLAANANQQNTTDLGQFRTLRPALRNYDINGTVATRLSPWLTANATLHWSRNQSDYLRGLPSALFVLSPTNAFSPFSNDVALAFFGKKPLHSRSTQHAGDANVTFNANWGSWSGNLNLRHAESRFDFSTEHQTVFGNIPIADTVNPFTTDFTNLIALRTDRTSSRSFDTLADLTLNGPVVSLPAGSVVAVIESRLDWNHLNSTSTFVGFGNATFRRNEQSIRGGLDVPLTSHDSFLPEVGDLSASIELGRSHFSDAGSVNHYTYGLTWEPRPPFRLHASIDETDAPAPIQTLGGPVVITPDVRVFDPLTGQTVDVTEISGGNPFLLPQKTKLRNVSALVRLVPKLNLELNAEYTDSDIRNFVSSLPEASAAVELAFPDRFLRDANGVLTTVNLTPVNFQSHREKRLRWGLSMNTKIGAGTSAAAVSPGTPRPRYRPPTYLQLTVNHTMVFSDEILIRPGLNPVDLLHGGAIGIGGGRLRHQVDSTAAITSGGLGLRMGVSWRGPSELISNFNGVTDTLHFSPLLAVNLRAFADLKRFLPHDDWARGLRLSVDVVNVTNKRQTVHDSFGNTPIQFQPGIRDPLGRTIEVELRKVF